MAIGDVHLRRDCCDDDTSGGGAPIDFYDEGSVDDDFIGHEGNGSGSDVVPGVVPFDGTLTTATFSNLLGRGVTGQTYEVFVNGVSAGSFAVGADTLVAPINIPVVAGDRVGVYAGPEGAGQRARSPHVTLYLT